MTETGHADPEYTIAICHYNMADTVEKSLRSILNQVDDRFEVLVVDDGSDDGSIRILEELTAEYERLRLVKLDYDSDRNLGETRNISFEKSRGKYVLESLDADDRYGPAILDFVRIYHQIEKQVEFSFYLKGKSINMAPRELLLEIPYRNFKRAQDRDLWRRLFAEEKIIWLEHEPFFEIIRDPYDKSRALRNLVNLRVSDFRSGVTFRSYLREYCLQAPRVYKGLWRFIIGFVAFCIANYRGRHSLSQELRKAGTISRKIDEQSVTLTELESRCGIEIDTSELTEFGSEVFTPENYSDM